MSHQGNTDKKSSGTGGTGGGGGGGPRKESIMELAKMMDSSVRVKVLGGREFVGMLRGYDDLVNLVLDEGVEYVRGTWGKTRERCGVIMLVVLVVHHTMMAVVAHIPTSLLPRDHHYSFHRPRDTHGDRSIEEIGTTSDSGHTSITDITPRGGGRNIESFCRGCRHHHGRGANNDRRMKQKKVETERE
jgi:small nuclear ribonucleoprotein (snRNP)-like protein